MFMKKLLVTGCSGMLGGNLVFALQGRYDLYGIYNTSANPELRQSFQLDLTDTDRLGDIVAEIRPDAVVHCAALTNVDACEDDYVLARRINALASRNLVEASGSQTRFIYISTDSVFDGRRGGYSETDLPSPLNSYAKSKLEGEWYVEQESRNYVIIRTNMFGFNRIKGQSFAEWIINNLTQRKKINMFTDVVFSAVSVFALVEFINRLTMSDFIGRLNIGVCSPISKYDFGVRLANIFGLDASLISPMSVDEFKFKAKRPKNTSLDISKAKDILGTMPDIDQQMALFHSRRLK
jgi:dTDP-4-dehydrorhamnose reductase